MIKILLTADVHLGLKFANVPDVQAELAEQRYRTLERIVALANERECHLLAVAGDLFDTTRIAQRDIARAKTILAGFSGNAVVVLPGNHDPLPPNSSDLWQHFLSAPGDNVVVLADAAPLPLGHYNLDAVLYPAPCNAKHSAVNRIDWIAGTAREPSARHHIGIAHGSLEGVSPDEEQKYFPMTPEQLSAAGLHCWLMGHTDRMQYPAIAGAADRIFYPGTPEPNGFNCSHEGRVWLLTLDDDNALTTESIVTGAHRFVHIDRDLRSAADLRDLEALFAGGAHARNCVRVRCTGRLAHEEYEALPGLRERLRPHAFFLDWDDARVAREITAADIDREFPSGSLPHRLLSALSQKPEDAEALQIAYELITEAKQ